jgi:putative ABC transport system permease protein
MLKNYLTLAIRNLLKRKMYSFINIAGLAIGVAVCLVILKYVDFELSYDNFHQHADRTYRYTSDYYQNGELRGSGIMSGLALGPALLADVPEIKAYVRTHPMYGGAVVSYKKQRGDAAAFHEEKMQFVDSTFFDVFSYNAAHGDLHTALDNPRSIVLSPHAATKYFGDEDPLGKILQISGGWADGDYEVTAVLKDVPSNSHFIFDFLLPTHNLLESNQYQQEGSAWGWNNFVTYVELHPNTSVQAVEEKMSVFVDKYQGENLKRSNAKLVIKFQPIRNIHLRPGLGNESSATVSVNTIYFFIVISIFILSIAWINYINLSTARALERAREVGIKKAIGAYRSQLVAQFAFESVLVNLLSVILATGIAILLLPVLAEIVNKDLRFDFSDHRFWLILSGLFVVGAVVSGAYPAFILSSFKITEVLKGKTEKMTGGFSLRKVLVVFQFAASLILIAGTFAIYRQVMFMRSQDKGLIMEQMLVFKGPRVMEQTGAKERLITLKNELSQIPGVKSVATSAAIPGGNINWGTNMRRDGAERQENKSGSVVWVDPDFVKTYDIPLLSGRTFNPEIASDMDAVLINEAALTTFGLGDPEHALQERIILGGDTVAILGVLKNYNWHSLKADYSPFLFKADTISRSNFSLLLSGSKMNEIVRQVEQQYKNMFPGNPFDYFFLDDFFNSQYKDEQQFANLFTMFAILAIIIACLGLWGLASFTTAQKLKEIGIRKVLGASSTSIMSLLSWQFFKLVLIASILAIPLTWYGVQSWLGNFPFRIGLEWDLFVVPVVILATLALGTVSLQILRGASINPATILRSE